MDIKLSEKIQSNYQEPVNDQFSYITPLQTEESILDTYLDLANSNPNLSAEAKHAETLERPFDFFDDEEFAFGVNLINKNVACVGDNITKLIQMAQEPWPDNVKLFQPYEVEQILLPDNASCLAVQAFLKMCNLPFEVEMRWNAEFMSPSGRVPFIKCGAFVVSELEPVVQFAANKGITLCSKLSTEEKAEMRAYMSLITNVLVNAELYISWLDDETFNAVTKIRNSSVYPWPLGWIQTRSKRNAVAKRLKALHWYEKTLDQVLSDVEQCCNSLSQRLGDRDYFFENPTPVDALIYGHIRALLSATGPKTAMMIKPITSSLLRHLIRMTNLTKMKLTCEEEYLITQAFQITRRRSPDRTLSNLSNNTAKVQRSKVSLKNASKDNLYGFKPFASKQILILSSKEGQVTCEYEGSLTSEKTNEISEDPQEYVSGIVDTFVDKACEIAYEVTYQEALETDFEVIIQPNDACINNISNIDKTDLETIEENDFLDKSNIIEPDDDALDLQANDNDNDSDGLVNDKHLSSEMMSGDNRSSCVSPDNVDLGDYKCLNDVPYSSGQTSENISMQSEPQFVDSIESESNATLTNGQVSVESLLEYLRRNNAYPSSPSIADID